jgi:hypothetical protein
MSALRSIKIESPRTDNNVTQHFILQQKARKKILSLKLDWAKFDIDKFKELYSGVVIDMSMDRLLRLQAIEDEEEIVKFLKKKKCEQSLSEPSL